jgi:hypothetical protein
MAPTARVALGALPDRAGPEHLPVPADQRDLVALADRLCPPVPPVRSGRVAQPGRA